MGPDTFRVARADRPHARRRPTRRAARAGVPADQSRRAARPWRSPPRPPITGSTSASAMVAEDPPVDAVVINAYGPWSRARELVADAGEVVGERQLWVTEFGSDQDNGAVFDPAGHLEPIIVPGRGAHRRATSRARVTLYPADRPAAAVLPARPVRSGRLASPRV